MSEKKAYPLRISAAVLEAVQRWADDDLRSINAQIEFVLRDALRRNGRMKATAPAEATSDHGNAAGAATTSDQERQDP
jgi:hypothetical protein